MLGRRERVDQTWRILYIGVMPRGPYRRGSLLDGQVYSDFAGHSDGDRPNGCDRRIEHRVGNRLPNPLGVRRMQRPRFLESLRLKNGNHIG
jgi:hypothetical protein